MSLKYEPAPSVGTRRHARRAARRCPPADQAHPLARWERRAAHSPTPPIEGPPDESAGARSNWRGLASSVRSRYRRNMTGAQRTTSSLRWPKYCPGTSSIYLGRLLKRDVYNLRSPNLVENSTFGISASEHSLGASLDLMVKICANRRGRRIWRRSSSPWSILARLLLLLYSRYRSSKALSLKLSDTRVYEPQIRARLGTTAHFCEVVVRSFILVQFAPHAGGV